jgi:hypothetical protein
MKRLSYLLIIFAVGLFACDSDPDNDPTSESYLPLAVGNYWVYKTYSTDSTQYNPLNINYIQEDSIYVDRFEILEDDTFYVLKGVPAHMLGEYNQNGEVYLRDSLEVIFGINNKIIFMPFLGNLYRNLYIDYGTTQNGIPSVYREYIEHTPNDSSITTPESTIYWIYQISGYYCTDYDTTLNDPGDCNKLFSRYFAQNAGMVCDYEGDSLYAFLSRYHIQ